MIPLFVELLGWILLLAGIGTSLVGLPGPLLGILSLVIWWWLGVGPPLGAVELIILIALLSTAEAAEQLGGFVGMKWSGIHRTGWVYAIAGGIIGGLLSVLLLNPIWILVALIAGAWIGELRAGTSPLEALRVVLSFLLGKFGGYLFKNVSVTGVLLYLVGRQLVSVIANSP